MSEEAIAGALVKGKYNMDKASYNLSYTVDWGGDYVLVAVAVDADGKAGHVMKQPFTASKENAEPLESIPAE